MTPRAGDIAETISLRMRTLRQQRRLSLQEAMRIACEIDALLRGRKRR